MNVVKLAVAYVLAVLVTTLLGSAVSTHFVLQGLTDLGVAIGPSERISSTLHDFVGMGPLFGAIVAGGFLVAFAAAGLLARMTGWRTLVFAVAGAVAMLVMLYAMKLSVGVTGIAGARSVAGVVGIAVAGMIGGLFFAAMRKPRES